MNRTKKLGTCVAAAVTILAGGTYLSTPAEAAEVSMGCTIEEYQALMKYADDTCREAGASVGVAGDASCDGGAYEVEITCY